jgi:hypothetical protein
VPNEVVICPFTVGDNLPVTATLTSSDYLAVQSAQYQIYSRASQSVIESGVCSVSVVPAPNPQTIPPTAAISTLSIPKRPWPQADTFVIRFLVTWSNGETDIESVVIQVLPPPV